MKTIKFSAIIATALVMVISLTMLTSFKSKPSVKEKKPVCATSCTFVASSGTISTGMIENSYGTDSKSGITMGTSQTASLGAGGTTSIDISVFLPFGHPAGNINVYQNGNYVTSFSIPSNSIGIDAANFSSSCGDNFVVTW